MKEVKIKTMTRPDIPNRNGIIYTRESYERCIRNILINGIMIPVIIGKPPVFENETLTEKLTVPIELIIGYVTSFDDEYIDVDLLNWFIRDERYKEINHCIENDTLRAYMCYIGKRKRAFSELSSGNVIVTTIFDIDRITCFCVGNN